MLEMMEIKALPPVTMVLVVVQAEGAWLLPQMCYMYRLTDDGKCTPIVLQSWAVCKVGGDSSKILVKWF